MGGGCVGGSLVLARSSVSLVYPDATALLQEAGCGVEVYLERGQGTGDRAGAWGRKKTGLGKMGTGYCANWEQYELRSVRTGLLLRTLGM